MSHFLFKSRNYCQQQLTPKQVLKKEGIREAMAIRADFESLSKNNCSCPNSIVDQVVYAHRIVDIARMARRFRDPIVMALEVREQGARLFTATTRRHIYHYLSFIRTRRPEYKTWHEVASGVTPLRLYFDLEFYYESNPDILVDEMLPEFRRVLKQKLTNHFLLNDEENDIRIIELDASTEQKFSRHMIIHMFDKEKREIGFSSAAQLKNFVTKSILRTVMRGGFFVRSLVDVQDTLPLIDTIIYHDKPGQNFRIMGSPKFGKENVLKLLNPPKSGHEFQFHDPDCKECEKLFDDSLITLPVDLDTELITKENLDIYRRNVRSTEIDSTIFGERSKFYSEIEFFNRNSNLFDKNMSKDLFDWFFILSGRTEFYDDLSKLNLTDYVDKFQKFKEILSVDPIDWDYVYAYGGDILESFYTEDVEMDQLLKSDEETVEIKRGAGAKRRAAAVGFKYIQLKKELSDDAEKWEMMKWKDREQKKEMKFNDLKERLNEEAKFSEWMKNRLDEEKKRGSADEKSKRAVELAVAHSNRLREDYERKMAALKDSNAVLGLVENSEV